MTEEEKEECCVGREECCSECAAGGCCEDEEGHCDEDPRRYKLADSAIVMVRELVQFSLLTGTNLVDHFRSLELEPDEAGRLTPTLDYIEAYNAMILRLNEEAQRRAKEAQETLATED